MFAMVITVVGLTAVAGLVVEAIRLESRAKDSTSANALLKAKIEELSNYSPGAAQRARGGGLNSNITGYYDNPDPRFIRRWQIENNPADAGVPSGTQRVTVTIISDRAEVTIPNLELKALIPN